MGELLTTAEAAKRLEMGVSTLRNYAAIVENKGYPFERNSHNGRIFRMEDLQMISNMTRKILTDGFTVEQAAIFVVKHYQQTDKNKEMEDVMLRLEMIEARQNELYEMNAKFLYLLERFIGKVEESERDALLMERREKMKNKQKKKRLSIIWPLIRIK